MNKTLLAVHAHPDGGRRPRGPTTGAIGRRPRRPLSAAATAGGRMGCARGGAQRIHGLQGVGRLPGRRGADRRQCRAAEKYAVRIHVVRAVPRGIDTQVPPEQTIAVRWIVRVLRTIPLTPWWVHARRQRNRREMREHLRRYYAPGQ